MWKQRKFHFKPQSSSFEQGRAQAASLYGCGGVPRGSLAAGDLPLGLDRCRQMPHSRASIS